MTKTKTKTKVKATLDWLLNADISEPMPTQVAKRAKPRKSEPILKRGSLCIQTNHCTRCGSEEEYTSSEPMLTYYQGGKRLTQTNLPAHYLDHNIEWTHLRSTRNIPACMKCIHEIDGALHINIFERQGDLFINEDITQVEPAFSYEEKPECGRWGRDSEGKPYHYWPLALPNTSSIEVHECEIEEITIP